MIDMNARRRLGAQGRRGNATVVALIAVTVLGGMSAGILALSTASEQETRAATEDIRAQFAAEAGVANALQELSLAFGDPAGRQAAGGAPAPETVVQDPNQTPDPAAVTDPVPDPTAVTDPTPTPDPTTTGGTGGDTGNTGSSSPRGRWSRWGNGGTGSANVGGGSVGTSGTGNNGNADPAEKEPEMSGVDLSAVKLGTHGAPMPLANSSYYSEIVELGDGFFQILATGMSGGAECRVEVIVQRAESPVYDNALFAGNSSGDPNYTLELGGRNAQADSITGDIYSGGDIDITGDAQVNGSIRSGGTVTPDIGTEGVSLTPPDLAGMDYANTADVKVADMFTASATYQSDAAGGSAYQMPETSPAHIFRKNPSDRSTETSGTSKDDYFLEDPYENVRTDPNQNGADAYHITLSGHGGKPGADGESKVYYIDGNLWLHNKMSFSMKLFAPTGQDGTKVTFVVRGNVYFSDNLFLQNKNKDGIAFIALKDENVTDSGNIYFGDPVYGTLKHMEAFMYAENNFYDNNLDASGSASVTVIGNMTAGNQVLINRDYGNQHSKLTVEFDDRISSGALSMPGLPEADDSTGGFSIVSWREVPIN